METETDSIVLDTNEKLPEDFQDPEYRNWIKAGLGLKVFKDELITLEDHVFKALQDKFLTDVDTKEHIRNSICTSCTTPGLLPCPTFGICEQNADELCNYHETKYQASAFKECPNKICHHILQFIVTNHKHNNPSWRNTDARKWCTNHWEIAKCYMPTNKEYRKVSAATETDCCGIFTTVANCEPVQKELNVCLNTCDHVFYKIQKERHDTSYPDTRKLPNQQLELYLDMLIAFFAERLTFENIDAQGAIEKLNELKKACYAISREDPSVQRIISRDRKYSRAVSNISGQDSSIPVELWNLDPKDIELYKKALAEGSERNNTVRIMIVGHAGVGKTSLTRNLMNKSLDDIETTNGIEIHACSVNPDGNFVEEDTGTHTTVTDRLVNVAKCQHVKKHRTSSLSHHTSPQPDKVISEKIGETGRKKNERVRASQEQCYKTIYEESDNDSTKILKAESSIGETKHAERIFDDNYSRKEDVKEFSSKIHSTDMNEVKDSESKLRVWDFGGQFVFYATHQLFLTKASVYILVLDATKQLTDEVIDEDSPVEAKKKDVATFCKFWMHSINSFVGDQEGMPPVILVATHKDQLSIEEREHKSDILFDKVRELFEGSPALRHIQKETFCIDNMSGSDNDIVSLRRNIIKVAEQQESWNRELPAKWIQLENALWFERTKRHITFNEVRQIDSKNELPVKDNKELQVFLTYHHLKGNLIYYNDHELGEHVVLDPQWIIDAFKSLITSEKFCKAIPDCRAYWIKLRKQAILHPELAEKVWKADTDNDFFHHEKILMMYFNKLGIFAKPIEYELESKKKKSLEYYFVPSLLKSRSSSSEIDTFMNRDNVAKTKTSLVFEFDNVSVCPTLYHRVIVAALGQWPVINYKQTHLLFENVGIFRLDNEHIGEIRMTNTSVDVMVVNLLNNEIDTELCVNLQKFVSNVLTNEFGRFQSESKSNFEVGLKCQQSETCGKNVLKRKDFRGQKEEPCPDYNSNHKLDIQMLNRWFHVIEPSASINLNRDTSTLRMKGAFMEQDTDEFETTHSKLLLGNKRKGQVTKTSLSKKKQKMSVSKGLTSKYKRTGGSKIALNSQRREKNQTISLPRQTLSHGDSKPLKHSTVKYKSEHYALIEQEIETMNTNCKNYGRGSYAVKASCIRICEHLRQCSSKVVSVWPAYTPRKEELITFVIITTEEYDNEMVLPHTLNVLFRSVISCSGEEKAVRKHILENQSEVNPADSESCRKLLQANSEILMARHTNLNIISVSPVLSHNYMKGQHVSYSSEPCIVFFVSLKGFIPIEEEEFPKFIGKYKTDVREGNFELYGPPEKIQMGCAIRTQPDGGLMGGMATIGAFVEEPSLSSHNEVYGLTCAHAVYHGNDWNDLIHSKEKSESSDRVKVHIYNPLDDTSKHIGHVIKAVYRVGENGESGCEAALFKVGDPTSLAAGFPEDAMKGATFTGQFYKQLEGIPWHSTVFKYGSETKLTRQMFHISHASVRTGTLHNAQIGICLHNLIEVKSSCVEPFAKFGDSGALVCMYHDNNDNDVRAVGIIAGGTDDGNTVFITPIYQILKALGLSKVNRLKTF